MAAEVDGVLALALHRQRKPSGRLRVSMPARRTLANSPSLLAQLALGGVGIAGVDRLLVRHSVELGRLQRLLPEWQLPGSSCWAVFPERRLMPLRTRVFLEAMSTLLEACPMPGD